MGHQTKVVAISLLRGLTSFLQEHMSPCSSGRLWSIWPVDVADWSHFQVLRGRISLLRARRESVYIVATITMSRGDIVFQACGQEKLRSEE